MAHELLDLLGYDADDPRVIAGRRNGASIARLIETLVRLREELKLTQTDVARRMETTQSSVSSFERSGGDPRLSTILRYADALGAEVRMSVVAPPAGAIPGHVTARSARAFVPKHYIAPPSQAATC